MKKWLIIGAAFAALLLCISVQRGKIERLKSDNVRERSNIEALMQDAERYRVNDSISAIRCQALELQLSEYVRFREQDLKTIEAMKLKTRDLERVTAAQLKTIERLSVPLADTVIVRDSIAVPAGKFSYHDKWTDFEGIVTDDTLTARIENRDSLLVVESVIMSRCLFKRLRHVKSRNVDVLSRNPNTTIIGIDYVVLEK